MHTFCVFVGKFHYQKISLRKGQFSSQVLEFSNTFGSIFIKNLTLTLREDVEVDWELTSGQFEKMADLIDCLGPFADFTTAIQSSSEPTMQSALPGIIKLTEDRLTTPAAQRSRYSGRTSSTTIMPTPLQREFQKQARFFWYGDSSIKGNAAGGYLDGLGILGSLVQCSVLDPLLYHQLKTLVADPLNSLVQKGCLYQASRQCQNQQSGTRKKSLGAYVLEQAENEVQVYATSIAESLTTQEEPDHMAEEHLGALEFAAPSTSAAVEEGIKWSTYQGLRRQANIKLLQWWGTQASAIPALALTARRFLAVQSTSAQSERDFSAAGAIVTEKRARLQPSTAEMLTFMKANDDYVMQFIRRQYPRQFAGLVAPTASVIEEHVEDLNEPAGEGASDVQVVE